LSPAPGLIARVEEAVTAKIVALNPMAESILTNCMMDDSFSSWKLIGFDGRTIVERGKRNAGIR